LWLLMNRKNTNADVKLDSAQQKKVDELLERDE
jgi:hypothetical protein